MSIKEELKKLVEKFSTIESNEVLPTPLVFISAKLLDGSAEVKSEGEDFTIGAKLIVVSPEGEFDAPNGEHKLEDGRIITTEDSYITDIKSAEEVIDEATEEIAEEENLSEVIEVVESVEEFKLSKEEFATVVNSLESLNEEFQTLRNEYNSLKEEFTKLINTPATPSVVETKFERVTMSAEDKRVERLKQMKSINLD